MKRLAVAAVLAVSASPVLAHAGTVTHDSLLAGLAHPILGADHLLAMIAIGVLATTHSGVARFALPSAFVAAMGAGLLTSVAGVTVPFVEPMILTSLFILGALLVVATRPALWGGMALAALFGFFHGAAHGSEIGAATTLPYATGVLAATALLHALGAGLGTLMGGRSGNLSFRFLGAGLTLGGMALALG